MADFDLGTARGHIEIDSSGLEFGLGKAGTATNQLDNTLRKASGSMAIAGGVLTGIGVAAIGGFGVAVNAAAKFDKVMSGIQAVSGATVPQMDAVRKKALQLGADTVFSAGEAGQAIEELVKAGLSLPDVLNGAADATVALAAAGQIALPEAATIAANAMNQFALKAADMPKVADLIAGAANASAIDVSEFGLSLQQVGAVAHLAGLSFSDTAIAIAEMGNAGIKGSDAGTSLKTFLQNLIPQTKTQIELFDKLGITTDGMGNKFFDAQGKAKGLKDISQVLQDSLKGMSKEQQLATLQTLFGSDAIRGAAILAENGAAGYDKLSGAMSKVTAADVAKTRMDNLAGSLEQLKGSIETAEISFGKAAQGPLRIIVDMLTKLVNSFAALSPQTQQVILVVVGVVATLATLAGTFLLVASAVLRFVNVYLELKRAMAIAKELQLATKAMQALNASFLTNPVFLIIAALVLLGIGLYELYKHSETFRKAVDALWQGVQVAFHAIMDVVKVAFDFIKKYWMDIVLVILGPIGLIIEGWRKFGGDIKRIIGGALDSVSGVFDPIISAIKNVLRFFELVGLGIKAMVEVFKGNGLTEASGTIVGTFERIALAITNVIGWFTRLPGNTVHFVKEMVDGIISFITNLPDMMGNAASTGVEAFLNFLAELPKRAGFLIGFVIGRFIKFEIDGVMILTRAAIAMVEAVVGFFIALPGRVWNELVATYNFFVNFGTQMLTKATEIGTSVLEAVTSFFTQLPGVVWGFLVATYNNVTQFGIDVGNKSVEIGTNVLNTIISFFQQLPGVVWGFLVSTFLALGQFERDAYAAAQRIGSQVLSAITGFISRLPGEVAGAFTSLLGSVQRIGGQAISEAAHIGTTIYNGIRDGIMGLPGLVGDVLQRVIDAIKGAIKTAFNAVKDFAGGLWKGFKEGLFGSPHTKIEYAVWDMTDNVSKSIATLKEQMRTIGAVGSTIPSPVISLGVARSVAGLAPTGGSTTVQGDSTQIAGDSTVVHAHTDADPVEIAEEIAWKKRLRTRVA